MNIIEFPKMKRKKTPSNLGKDVLDTEFDGEIIPLDPEDHYRSKRTIDVFSDAEFSSEDLFSEDATTPDILHKIVESARSICKSEKELSAAVLAVIDELVARTGPIRKNVFLPKKVFFSMMENPVYEKQFSSFTAKLSCLEDYRDLNLTRLAIMLDQNWQFTPAQRIAFEGILHIFGALPPIDLGTLKAYLSKRDFEAFTSFLNGFSPQ